MMARVYPLLFGWQEAEAGGDLPEEWQALMAHQAAVRTVLRSRMSTAVRTMRRRQAPAVRLPILTGEAERMLTAQAPLAVCTRGPLLL
jgi:hypothetical protein